MFSKLRKRIASKKNEEGAGFVGLIGISMLVTLTASSVIASATFGTYTTNTRLSQQKAQDAAEAGVAEAISQISSGEIAVPEGEYKDYKYKYEIHRSSENIAPTKIDPNGIKTEPGYPEPGDKWLIVKSTGESTNTMKAESAIVATYKWQDPTVAVIPQVVSGMHVTFNNSKIKSSPGVAGSPIVLTDGGSFQCTNSSEVNANTKIKKYKSTSYISDFSNCTFNGDLESSEKAILNTTTNTATINGQVCAPTGSSVSIDDADKGDHELRNPDCGIKGSLYGYSPIVDNTKFKTLVVPSSACSNLINLEAYIESHTTPTVLDFDNNCSTQAKDLLNDSTVKTFELQTDITYLAKEWRANNLTISSKTGDPVNLNFVSKSDIESPDSIQPNNIITNRASKVKYTNGASGILYSAGTVHVELGSEIIGQIVAGSHASIDSSTLKYLPITLPGTTKPVSTSSTIKPLVRVF